MKRTMYEAARHTPKAGVGRSNRLGNTNQERPEVLSGFPVFYMQYILKLPEAYWKQPSSGEAEKRWGAEETTKKNSKKTDGNRLDTNGILHEVSPGNVVFIFQ